MTIIGYTWHHAVVFISIESSKRYYDEGIGTESIWSRKAFGRRKSDEEPSGAPCCEYGLLWGHFYVSNAFLNPSLVI